MSDYLIVGGGVIGMMMARELSTAGASVTLVDRRGCAEESSWAGGGIVSPLYPWRYKDPITALATWSQSSYVLLSQELLEETGYDPELRQKGMFMVSVEDADDARSWAAQHHRPLTTVDADFLYQKEPHLKEGLGEALWMPEVASIRNPRLGRSLRQSLVGRDNVTVLEHQPLESLIIEGEQVKGIKTNKGEIRADKTIIAAGSWSGELVKPLGLNVPVEPVRGQMMIFKAPQGLVNRVVLMDGRYVIPRNDGRVLIGSTMEHTGFEKETTEDARASLYETAINIVPELADHPIEHHWAGLRPGSPEGVPFIGAVPGYDNLHMNAGHFRNGLVLAPASTRLLADQLLGRTPIIDPAAYTLSGRVTSI